jgi:L-alanine-DL-glutamate epimerase-like enolase superfamily enzyme
MEVCGEDADGVMRAVAETIEPALTGRDALAPAEARGALKAALVGQPAAEAMADMALYDLLGKARGLPLHRLLGGTGEESIATSMTIGIMPVDETLERARRWVARGFTCLKLKGGLDWEEDAARTLAVREAVGEGVELRFDANQGFDVEQSVSFAERARPARLELIEQPTPWDRPEMLAEVSRAVGVPVMADESLKTLEHAEQICGGRGADMLNVKLMKVGGISRAAEIDDLAAAAGMPVMVGCMDEAALAIAAGLHFALARPNVKYADLDGHLDLRGDPTDGAVILENGRLRPTGRPGLGFDLVRE